MEMDEGGLYLVFVHHRRALVTITRWLPEHQSAPLSAPVNSSQSYKLNFYMGIVLVLFMTVCVVVIVCCCYHLEWRLRIQARSAAWRVGRADGILRQDPVSSEISVDPEKMVTKQETNISVMMPGDSIPSYLARVRPHRSVSGANFADLSEIGGNDAPQTLR